MLTPYPPNGLDHLLFFFFIYLMFYEDDGYGHLRNKVLMTFEDCHLVVEHDQSGEHDHNRQVRREPY